MNPARMEVAPGVVHEQFEMYSAARLGPGVRIQHAISPIIDGMGVLSGRAQGLMGPITSTDRLCGCPDQRLYILFSHTHGMTTAVGIIKVGTKRLFITSAEKMHEIEPLCILDFYVHESVQRCGTGRILFEHVLDSERVEPHQLAFDRPSSKLMNFLKKYYSLGHFQCAHLSSRLCVAAPQPTG